MLGRTFLIIILIITFTLNYFNFLYFCNIKLFSFNFIMRTISKIRLYQILDSRGFPTVEANIIDNEDNKFIACTPSGASTGEREAIEIRDKKENYFLGKSVESIIEKEQLINELFQGKELNDHQKLDQILLDYDSSPQKEKIGGNLTTALTFCFLKACAGPKLEVYQYLGKEKSKIPRPFVNIINGGKHAGNKLQIQEFMIVPKESNIDEMTTIYVRLS